MGYCATEKQFNLVLTFFGLHKFTHRKFYMTSSIAEADKRLFKKMHVPVVLNQIRTTLV